MAQLLIHSICSLAQLPGSSIHSGLDASGYTLESPGKLVKNTASSALYYLSIAA